MPADPRDFSALVITGSAASVVTPDPWVIALRDFIAAAVERGVPVLGVCFGHQLLAWAVYGDAAVRRAARPEVGWPEISLTAPAPLLEGVLPLRPFASHADEVLAVDGMEVFARSADCAVHGLKIPGAPAWGVQFHTEMGRPEVAQLARYRQGKHPDLGLDAARLIADYRDTTAQNRRILANFFRLGQVAG